MKEKYDDIIHLAHHVSSKRPQMSMADRAAQFSPFAALTGYDSAIRETARQTDERIELCDDALHQLNIKMQLLSERLDEGPTICITYFEPDDKKSGGKILTVNAKIRKTDLSERKLYLQDGKTIPMDDVLNLEGDIFDPLDFGF